MKSYRFNLNGKSVEILEKGDKPLLWVLRENLGLTGSKFGCGRGLCGSCSVHLEGKPLRSCITPLSSIENHSITTIEGISEGELHPVQKAWLELDVPQCGYCQTGQIMHAISLIEEFPEPNQKQIDRGMAQLICRCGTYARIKKGIQRACEIQKESSKGKVDES